MYSIPKNILDELIHVYATKTSFAKAVPVMNAVQKIIADTNKTLEMIEEDDKKETKNARAQTRTTKTKEKKAKT